MILVSWSYIMYRVKTICHELSFAQLSPSLFYLVYANLSPTEQFGNVDKIKKVALLVSTNELNAKHQGFDFSHTDAAVSKMQVELLAQKQKQNLGTAWRMVLFSYRNNNKHNPGPVTYRKGMQKQVPNSLTFKRKCEKTIIIWNWQVKFYPLICCWKYSILVFLGIILSFKGLACQGHFYASFGWDVK